MEQVEEGKDCGSVEVGRVWNVCQIEVRNKFSALEADEDGEENVEGNAGYERTYPRVEEVAGEKKKKLRFAKIQRGKWKKDIVVEDEDWMSVCAVEGETKQMCLGFQVADVKKP